MHVERYEHVVKTCRGEKLRHRTDCFSEVKKDWRSASVGAKGRQRRYPCLYFQYSSPSGRFDCNMTNLIPVMKLCICNRVVRQNPLSSRSIKRETYCLERRMMYVYIVMIARPRRTVVTVRGLRIVLTPRDDKKIIHLS